MNTINDTYYDDAVSYDEPVSYDDPIGGLLRPSRPLGPVRLENGGAWIFLTTGPLLQQDMTTIIQKQLGLHG